MSVQVQAIFKYNKDLGYHADFLKAAPKDAFTTREDDCKLELLGNWAIYNNSGQALDYRRDSWNRIPGLTGRQRRAQRIHPGRSGAPGEPRRLASISEEEEHGPRSAPSAAPLSGRKLWVLHDVVIQWLVQMLSISIIHTTYITVWGSKVQQQPPQAISELNMAQSHF